MKTKILLVMLILMMFLPGCERKQTRISPLPGWWQQFVDEGGEWGVTENWHGGGVE